MSLQSSVSIIVPALNGASTINDMLNAVCNQSKAPKNTEIIIVDGGSTDGTQDIVRKYNVRLLEKKTPSPGAARNLGIRQATGDVIVHLNVDTLPTRRWLSELVKPFSDPCVVLAGGRTICYRPTTPADRFLTALGICEEKRTIFAEVFPLVPSGNMAVRRDCALGVGGWAEEMMSSEDADFTLRLLRKFSAQITYARRAILFHRNRKTDEELRRQAWLYGEGTAHLYLRYPEILNWDIFQLGKLAGTISWRTLLPPLSKVSKSFGLGSLQRIEFSYYHRFWTWWFWRGYFSMYLYHKYRPAPGSDSAWASFFMRIPPAPRTKDA